MTLGGGLLSPSRPGTSGGLTGAPANLTGMYTIPVVPCVYHWFNRYFTVIKLGFYTTLPTTVTTTMITIAPTNTSTTTIPTTGGLQTNTTEHTTSQLEESRSIGSSYGNNTDSAMLLRVWNVKKSDPTIPVFVKSANRKLAAIKPR